MRNKVLMFLVLFALLMCGNFLPNAVMAREIPTAVFLLAMQAALFGALMLVSFLVNPNLYENDRRYLAISVLLGTVVMAGYFVFQSWTVLRYLLPPSEWV